MPDPKTKRKSEKVIAGSASGKKTKPDEIGRDRSEGSRRGLIHAEKGECCKSVICIILNLLTYKVLFNQLAFLNASECCLGLVFSGFPEFF